MKLLDVNVLLAAHRDDHPQFAVAKPWFDELTSSPERFGVPRTVWGSFVRLATHRRVFKVPTPLVDAFAFIRAVIAQPGHVAVEAGTGHLEIFERLCRDGDAQGDLAADAFLAAVAVEHACELVSFDRDFARFPGLRWVRPGAEARN